ncbi:MAG: Ger(x)C family spore germination C-terminal domain-containing protein [Bacillota bacterium]
MPLWFGISIQEICIEGAYYNGGDPTPKMIEKGLEKLLTGRLNKVFSKLQVSEADILRLGQFFRKEIPRMDLKEWRSKYYQNLSTDFLVDGDIRNSGNLKNPD